MIQDVARREERLRLETLVNFGVLDEPGEAILDQMTELAAKLFDMPIALVTLIDATRQVVKSRYGTDLGDVPREVAFCNHTIRSDDVMIVADALADPRFRTNPLVTGAPDIRFYAGAALRADDGSKLGAVCVIDTVPHSFDPSQLELLTAMARLVMEFFKLRMQHREAAAARSKLDAIVAASPSGIVTALADGTVTSWNEGATRMLGWTRDETIGRISPIAQPKVSAERVRYGELVARGESIRNERMVVSDKAGRPIDVRVSGGPIRDIRGKIVEGVYLFDDVTDEMREKVVERNRYEILELTANDAPIDDVLARLVDNVELAIRNSMSTIVRVRSGALRYAAVGKAMPPVYLAAMESMAIGPEGISSAAAIFRGRPEIVSDVIADPAWAHHRELALASGIRACWAMPIGTATSGIIGAIACYSLEAREPTQTNLRVLAEAAKVAAIAIETTEARSRLEEMALHDALTDLPNRMLFEDRLRSAITIAKHSRRKLAVGMLDLDRFKLINDSLGHSVGDMLLQEVGTRLRRTVRAQDTVARMGGDEFLLLLADVEDREVAADIAKRTLASLEERFAPGGNELFVRGSLGLSIYPDDATEPSQLIRLADHAMYDAKANGGGYAFHDSTQAADGLTRLALETYLNSALEKHEFEVAYQPIVYCRSGETFGAEALLRWNHPVLGQIGPDRFIPLAEETGLIIPIGAWVLDEACRFSKRWSLAGGPGIVTVNVSPRQFEDRGFVDTVVASLLAHGIPPAHLCLEITESIIMRSPANAAATIAELRSLGVRALIDDFGSGYSSLNYLKRFSIHMLKIDRTFIAELSGDDSSSDKAIVRAIIAIGGALGLEVVAEGVETAEQDAFLRAAGCDFVQGFRHARPMTADRLLDWRRA